MKQDLIEAIESNDIDRLKELIGKNADINVIDDYGDPLLIIALHKKYFEIFRNLVQFGVNVNLKDKKGQTALHHAAANGYFDIAELLIANYGSLAEIDIYGNQPLWTAVFNVKKDLAGLNIVELYLKNGANKNHKNNAGRSPLDFANQVKFEPLLEVLQKY